MLAQWAGNGDPDEMVLGLIHWLAPFAITSGSFV